LKVTVVLAPVRFTCKVDAVEDPLVKPQPDSFAVGSVVQERATFPEKPMLEVRVSVVEPDWPGFEM